MPEQLPTYLDFALLKEQLDLTEYAANDNDLRDALNAAARAVEGVTHRRTFSKDEEDTDRYYTPIFNWQTNIVDLVSVTTVAVDPTGSGTFTEEWTENTDFVLEPLNADADRRPYDTLRSLSTSFSGWKPRSIKVTGIHGWPEVPAGVIEAVRLLSHRLLRRTKDAPFGLVTVGIDVGAVMRIARSDPDVMFALDGLERTQALA